MHTCMHFTMVNPKMAKRVLASYRLHTDRLCALKNKLLLFDRVSIVLVMLPAVMLVVVMIMVILVCMKEEWVLTIFKIRRAAHSFCSTVCWCFHNFSASVWFCANFHAVISARSCRTFSNAALGTRSK